MQIILITFRNTYNICSTVLKLIPHELVTRGILMSSYLYGTSHILKPLTIIRLYVYSKEPKTCASVYDMLNEDQVSVRCY